MKNKQASEDIKTTFLSAEFNLRYRWAVDQDKFGYQGLSKPRLTFLSGISARVND